MKPAIFPYPQTLTMTGGTYVLPSDFNLLFDYKRKDEFFRVVNLFCDSYEKQTGKRCYPLPDYPGRRTISVTAEAAETLTGEAYTLTVSEDGVKITFGTGAGLFRAFQTFLQIIGQYRNELPSMEIQDWPDIEKRAFMLDISRGKVPKIEYLYRFVDILAGLKYNQFQLYMENPCFEYASYPTETRDVEALTPHEILLLSQYCKDRYIELVPNQNSFGHLYAWLTRPEFRSLAASDECASLNPVDEKSMEFIGNLYDSLFPCFDSDYVNVGCDEVGDLSWGKLKELCDEVGEVTLYCDFLLKLHAEAKKRGKTMMFWADIIFGHPEYLEKLPRDIIPLAWEYQGSLEGHCQKLHELGFQYYACPGTSSWNTIFGDPERASYNILASLEGAIKYNAMGAMLTDWGDKGHTQFPAVSYMATGLFAGAAWCFKENGNYDYTPVKNYFDQYVFRCQGGSFSEILLSAGKMMPKRVQCGDCELFLNLQMAFSDEEGFAIYKDADILQMEAQLDKLEAQAKAITLDIPDGNIFLEEFSQGIRFFHLLAAIFHMKWERHLAGGMPDYVDRLWRLQCKVYQTRTQHVRVWAMRNYVRGSGEFWDWHMKRCLDEIESCCNLDREKSGWVPKE